MKKKRAKSPVERAYAAEVRRIKQFIRRAEKRRYIISDTILPKKPKRITAASVRRLSRIRPETIYKKSMYAGPLSYGEIIPAEKARKLEKKAAAQKAKETRKRNKEERERQKKPPLPPMPPGGSGGEPPEETSEDTSLFDRVVIDNFFSRLNKFQFGSCYNYLITWMRKLIRENGEHEVALMLQTGAEAGVIIKAETVYRMEYCLEYITKMMKFLDVPSFYRNQVMEDMEEAEFFNDYDID
jgi:hypothetical protein